MSSAVTPALVALKDGFTADWQAMTAATSMSLTVHGPYSVLVVCGGGAGASALTWEYLGTPKDGKTVTAPCSAAAPAVHSVTGTAAQAGSVSLGGASASSTTAGWDFSLDVPSGTYDLIATSAGATPAGDKIAIQRGVAVAGDMALAAIDVNASGQALSPVEFVLDQPLPDKDTETLEATVELMTANGSGPATIYQGDPATAIVVPAPLLASGDVQSVTVSAVDDGTSRGLQRTFHVGDTTTFALPSGIDDPAWVMTGGVLSVGLPQMPDLDIAKITVDGVNTSGASPVAARYEIDITTNYFGDTSLARPELDTTAPGYQASWKIDYSQAHTRSIVATKKVDAGLDVSSNTQQVAGPAS